MYFNKFTSFQSVVYLFELICVICFVLSGQSGLYASPIIQFAKAEEITKGEEVK